ncbi:hypothetical protein ADA01nite_00410 [Aneurinibacillus danicus]|jgi:hypothetical protein|uniref:Uncharacterized protein n=1 Tax=Aneurinibacillus danicus TaxID=267746 RepID=A0A511V3D0_9BACL|nr:hypothetical protein ADA01nite_00410 [Aneurinibacillus danicus]
MKPGNPCVLSLAKNTGRCYIQQENFLRDKECADIASLSHRGKEVFMCPQKKKNKTK